MKKINPILSADDDDKIARSRGRRVYFDFIAHESTLVPIDDKLLDLGFLISHGYDLLADIRDFLSDHLYVSEDSITHNITSYICYLRTGSPMDYTHLFIHENLSLEQLVDLFKEELLLRYVISGDQNELKVMLWDYNKLNDKEQVLKSTKELGSAVLRD